MDNPKKILTNLALLKKFIFPALVFFICWSGFSQTPPVPIPEGVTAQTIFAKYIEAIGGREAVKNVRSISIKASTEMRGKTLGMIIKKMGNKSVSEIFLNGTLMLKVAFNGKTGYSVMSGQKEYYTTPENEIAKKAAIFPELKSPGAVLEKTVSFEGEDTQVVKLNQSMHAHYDANTGLKLVEHKKSGNSTLILGYGDYKEIKGVKIPHRMTFRFSGTPEIPFKVYEVKINEGVSAQDFE